ncbi:hypothetical protein [Nocardioides sp. B-3]|uniref:hypothetical protein n=1 Tax=Nocardioides sp. B-3 TaxID=2895565 RepID=UPI002152C0E2|nr:hypothetical protein [Nocardioides sp. B-3]UUZ58997.1 hypothetical protein LP418_23835 [Nocardioides sp. B-3]
MSEYEQADLAPDASDDQEASETVGSDGWEAPSTGVGAVDAVLASVQALDDRSVAEHVAVFEQAHDQLRRALDPGHG